MVIGGDQVGISTKEVQANYFGALDIFSKDEEDEEVEIVFHDDKEMKVVAKAPGIHTGKVQDASVEAITREEVEAICAMYQNQDGGSNGGKDDGGKSNEGKSNPNEDGKEDKNNEEDMPINLGSNGDGDEGKDKSKNDNNKANVEDKEEDEEENEEK